jgi:hypothetical protein
MSPVCTARQAPPNCLPQLGTAERFDKLSVQHAPGLSEQAGIRTSDSKDLDDLRPPQQLGHREWVSERIACGPALREEVHRSATALHAEDYAPPLRNGTPHGPDMTLANDDRNTVEDGIVGLNLRRQTRQSVAVALDLVSQESPIDNGDIRSTTAMA